MSTEAAGKSDGAARAATARPAAGSYDVSRAQSQCHVCGRQIAPEEKLMAALRETPQGFERLDCDLQCWDKLDRADVIAFWRTTLPRPEQKKKLFVDDEVLGELFRRLAEASEPAKLNFRFVLGLILMRKRIVIYESSRLQDDRELWTVRMRGTEDRLDLLNPRLTEEQIVEVSRQIGEILNEEL